MGMRRRVLGRATLLLVASSLLMACASDGASPSTSSAPVTSSVPSETPSHAPDSAPPELAGRWRRNVQGETVILTLDGTGYHIQRGPASGSGRISVAGDEIEFYGSNLCDGDGTYTWSFDDGRLRFTEVVSDPCDGRTVVLLRGTFGRVEP